MGQRKEKFARLEGILYDIPTTDPAWTTLKEIEATVGNMTSDQILQITKLIEDIVDARTRIVKERIVETINALDLQSKSAS